MSLYAGISGHIFVFNKLRTINKSPLSKYSVLEAETGFVSQLWHSTSANRAFAGNSDTTELVDALAGQVFRPVGRLLYYDAGCQSR